MAKSKPFDNKPFDQDPFDGDTHLENEVSLTYPDDRLLDQKDS